MFASHSWPGDSVWTEARSLASEEVVAAFAGANCPRTLPRRHITPCLHVVYLCVGGSLRGHEAQQAALAKFVTAVLTFANVRTLTYWLQHYGIAA
jgi:hypothetical protein